MIRLPREEYKETVRILMNYNYNCLNIKSIEEEISGVSAPKNDGLPKAPYRKSDPTYNKYNELTQHEQLRKSRREKMIVDKALTLVKEDSKYIFEKLFKEGKSKWDIIGNGMSERTFVRRKSELIHAVNKEIKKMA